jgi:hypothetical protein
VLVDTKAKAFQRAGGDKRLIAERADGSELILGFDASWSRSVGRRTRGLRARGLGVAVTDRRTIEVDDCMRTSSRTSMPAATSPAPTSSRTPPHTPPGMRAVNALFGRFKAFKVDYSVIPWATFTDPEVARVGLNETEAKEQGIEYEVTTYGIDDLDRAIADESAEGLGQGPDRAGQGQDPRCDHRRRARRGSDHRIHPRDAPRHRPEQDPRHHPHLPDLGPRPTSTSPATGSAPTHRGGRSNGWAVTIGGRGVGAVVEGGAGTVRTECGMPRASGEHDRTELDWPPRRMGFADSHVTAQDAVPEA